MDIVDLVDLSKKIKVNSSESVEKSAIESIIYNKTTSDVEDSYGLSLYFPNEELEYYDKMIPIYKKIGFSDEYISIMNEYVNVIAGGNRGKYTVNNKDYETGENYQNYEWYDSDFINSYSDYYNQNEINVDELEVTEEGDSFVLHLSDDMWDSIVDIGTSLWYDDGEGYIDLGIDSYYEFNDNGDLKIEFDGTWLALNGNTVYYEVIESRDYFEKGRVPALLNGKEVYLILIFDKKNPEGKVVGAQPMNSYGNTTLYGKKYTAINEGDKIEFLFDYYDYDGEYEDSYVFGDEIIVGKDGLNISYEEVGDGKCIVYYVLTDTFNNTYYTESIIFE